MTAAREIGIVLGERIGVPAGLRGVEGTLFAKAVGAGAELAVTVGAAEGDPVVGSREGLVMESG